MKKDKSIMLKQYSYSLSSKSDELKPTQFYKASHYSIHFGSGNVWTVKFSAAFPTEFKKAIQKKSFIDEVLLTLEFERELKNENQRDRRRLLREQEPKEEKQLLDVEENQKLKVEYSEKARNNYTLPWGRMRGEKRLEFIMLNYFNYQYQLMEAMPELRKQFQIVKIEFDRETGNIIFGAYKKFHAAKDTKDEHDNLIFPPVMKVYQEFLFLSDNYLLFDKDNSRSVEDIEEHIDYIMSLFDKINPSMIKAKSSMPRKRYEPKLLLSEVLDVSTQFEEIYTKRNTAYSRPRTRHTADKHLRLDTLDTVEDYFAGDSKSLQAYIKKGYITNMYLYGIMNEKVIDITKAQ